MSKINFTDPKVIAYAFKEVISALKKANVRAEKANKALKTLYQQYTSATLLRPPKVSNKIKPFQGPKFTGDAGSPDLNEFLNQLTFQLTC